MISIRQHSLHSRDLTLARLAPTFVIVIGGATLMRTLVAASVGLNIE